MESEDAKVLAKLQGILTENLDESDMSDEAVQRRFLAKCLVQIVDREARLAAKETHLLTLKNEIRKKSIDLVSTLKSLQSNIQ
jgi:hypothetical protein